MLQRLGQQLSAPSDFNTPQYHEDFDAKETLVVAQPDLLGGNSAAKERARLARRMRNESKKDANNTVQESIDTPKYHEDFDTNETSVVEQPDLFSGNTAAKERAQRARQRRDEIEKSKKNRKKKVLESLVFVGDSESSDSRVEENLDENKSRQSLLPLRSSSKTSSKLSSIDTPSSPSPPPATSKLSSKSSSIDTPSSPSTPQATPKNRVPYHYRKDEDNTHLDGRIVPSDQAFSDMILDDGQALPKGAVWADFIRVESLTDKVSDASLNSFSYVYTHTMRYSGEVIWILQTKSNCDNRGTWGESSSCTISHREGIIRVNITHKGRRNLGQGWNTREKRELKLADLIRQSGEARQKELMSQ
jgi:hypothetical protein